MYHFLEKYLPLSFGSLLKICFPEFCCILFTVGGGGGWGGGGGGGGGGGRGVVFAGGREMKIFNTVFQDFGKNMVGKPYFQH